MNQKTSIPKGIVSFATIILLLSFILALTLAYENTITANVVKDISIDTVAISIRVKEVSNIKELNQLNEGWYQAINGYVYYLESFDSYVFLNIKIKNPDERNGLLVVDADGNIKFDETFNGLPGRQIAVYDGGNENSNENQINKNQITAQVTGLERVSGFAILSGKPLENAVIQECQKLQCNDEHINALRAFIGVENSQLELNPRKFAPETDTSYGPLQQTGSFARQYGRFDVKSVCKENPNPNECISGSVRAWKTFSDEYDVKWESLSNTEQNKYDNDKIKYIATAYNNPRALNNPENAPPVTKDYVERVSVLYHGDTSSEYVVKPGDTLTGIWWKLTDEEKQAWNNNFNEFKAQRDKPDKIHVGDIIMRTPPVEPTPRALESQAYYYQTPQENRETLKIDDAIFIWDNTKQEWKVTLNGPLGEKTIPAREIDQVYFAYVIKPEIREIARKIDAELGVPLADERAQQSYGEYAKGNREGSSYSSISDFLFPSGLLYAGQQPAQPQGSTPPASQLPQAKVTIETPPLPPEIVQTNGLKYTDLGIINIEQAPNILSVVEEGSVKTYQLFNSQPGEFSSGFLGLRGYYYDPTDGFDKNGIPKKFLIPSDGQKYRYRTAEYTIKASGSPGSEGYTYEVSSREITKPTAESSLYEKIILAEPELDERWFKVVKVDGNVYFVRDDEIFGGKPEGEGFTFKIEGRDIFVDSKGKTFDITPSSIIIQQEEKFYIDLGDVRVEATPDREGGYTYTGTDDGQYYVNEYGQSFRRKGDGTYEDLRTPIGPAPAPPAPQAPSPTQPQIGTLETKYITPPTDKNPRYVRLDNFEPVEYKDRQICEKVQCEEIKPGQQWVLGVGSVDIASPAGTQRIPTVSGIPTPQIKLEGPKRTGAVVVNNQLVEIYEKDKETNLQKIVVGRTYKKTDDGIVVDKEGKEFQVHPDIISGLDLKSLSAVDVANGRFKINLPKKEIDLSISDAIQTRTDMESGKTVQTVVYKEDFETGEKSGDKKVTTLTKVGQTTQKEEVYTFATGGTKTTAFKGDTNEIEKTTYKSPDGKTLEFIGGVPPEIRNELGNNIDRFLSTAASEGFSKPRIEGGMLKEGTKSITLNTEDNSVIVLENQRVTKQIEDSGAVTTYSGDVTYSDNTVWFGTGAYSYETYEEDDDGKLKLSSFSTSDGKKAFETDYKTNTVKVFKRDADGKWQETLSSDLVGPVKDSNSPVYGLTEVVMGGKHYYYDENIFGSTIYELKDVEGKQVRVKVNSFTVGQDKFTEDELEGIKALGLSINKQLPTTIAQQKSQAFFADVERVLTEFRGLGYYATLFFDEDSLLAWRDNVDRAFATLYLGTEYISSGLCSTYLDGEDEGVAYAETPQGLAQIGAHIEGTRTQAIQTGTGQEFVYKITFSIRNGDYSKDPRAPEEMNFNVVLRGERTANVFKQDQKVERGSSFSRTGRSAIVQESTALYSQVCIVFDEIPLRWKLDDKELCNSIVEAGGEATSVGGTTTTTTAGSGGDTTGDINDF